MNLGQ